MDIRQLAINERYEKENPIAIELKEAGWKFITDWNHFETCNMLGLQKEINNLIGRYKADEGYKDFRLHFAHKQLFYIWGKK